MVKWPLSGPFRRHEGDTAYMADWFTSAAGCVAALFGCVSFLGWYIPTAVAFNSPEALFSIHPVSALCILMLGIGLISAGPGGSWVPVLCALPVLLIGAASAMGTVFETRAPFNEFILHGVLRLPADYPERMSLNSALCCVLASVALLGCAGANKGIWRRIPFAAPAVLTVIISITGVYGYLGGRPWAYQWTPSKPMALRSALLLLVIGTGLCCQIARYHLKRDIVVLFFWGIVAPAVIVAAAYLFPIPWNLRSPTLHSMIQTVDALSLIVLGGLLIAVRRTGGIAKDVNLVACGLLCMGVLDLVHAGTNPLHYAASRDSISLALGGLFFALAWVPGQYLPNLKGGLWPVASAVFIVVMTAVSSISLPFLVPDVHNDIDYLRANDALTLAGGFLFLLAAAYHVREYIIQRNQFNYVFAFLCSLLGISGMLINMTETWNTPWWTWHLLGMSASLAALYYIFAMFQEMQTDLKAVNKDLQQSEERLNLALQSSGMGTWQWNVITGDIFLDERTERLVGYSKGEFTGKFAHIVERVAPDGRDRLQRDLYSSLESPDKRELQFSVVWPDGSEHNLAARGAVYRDSDGAARTVVGVCWDQTTEMQRERALRESQTRLQAILDNSSTVICAKDLEHRYILINRQFCKLLNCTEASMLNRYDYEIWPEETAAALHSNDDQVVRTGQAIEFEEVIPNVDGPHTYISVKFPLFDQAGSIYAVAGISTDITTRKRGEQRMHRQTIVLRDLVSELNRVNRELEQFAYIASHDLQEPLRTLITYSGFLKEDLGDKLSEEGRKDFDFLENAARRMQMLVRDLLSYSRSGRSELHKEQTPLDECVEEALANLTSALESARAKVQHDQLPCLFCDRMLMTQVFQNLLGNAIKFRSEAPPKIRVWAEQKNGEWIIGVSDNGIGISSDFQEQIFLPFKRLNPMRKYEGSGIGLAICQKVIERHGGRIWVESEPGMGSVFYFAVKG